MTVTGNVHAGSIIFSFDVLCAMGVEEFGVNRSAKDAENMFGNGWSDRKHGSSVPVGMKVQVNVPKGGL
jgi:hypothetical protein